MANMVVNAKSSRRPSFRCPCCGCPHGKQSNGWKARERRELKRRENQRIDRLLREERYDLASGYRAGRDNY